MEIKNVIFDLGGVILDIFPEETEKMFTKKLGISREDIEKLTLEGGVTNIFETGKISMQVFRNSIRRYSYKELSDEEIDEAWNAMIGTLKPGVISLLQEISEQKKVYLLSNTNPIHIAKFSENIKNDIEFRNFNRLFQGAYYSHKIGWRKPSREAYSFVVNKNRLNKEETLFIDDTLENIESAQEYGFKTLHLKGNLEDIKELILN